MSTNALEKITSDRFRVMSSAPRRKCQRNVVQMREAMAALFGNDSVAISCHCKRSKTGIGMVWFSVIDVEIAGLRVEDTPKRWVIFTLFVYCMFRATRYFAIVLLCILSCRKRPGCDSFLKWVVSNVILSIDAHTIVAAHYYSFVCYRNFSFIRTVEWENVRVFSLKRLDRLGATVR